MLDVRVSRRYEKFSREQHKSGWLVRRPSAAAIQLPVEMVSMASPTELFVSEFELYGPCWEPLARLTALKSGSWERLCEIICRHKRKRMTRHLEARRESAGIWRTCGGWQVEISVPAKLGSGVKGPCRSCTLDVPFFHTTNSLCRAKSVDRPPHHAQRRMEAITGDRRNLSRRKTHSRCYFHG